jgi:enoyl-CoA hydratase/carnithine racemase
VTAEPVKSGGYQFIDVQVSSRGVATITLRRPDRLNAINLPMSDELLDAEQRACEDPAVRVLVYRGAGRAFCAGRDLGELQADAAPELAWMAAGGWCRAWMLPKITVAAVRGYAVGGGALLATLCDFTLASPDAVFGYPEGAKGMGDIGAHPWIWLLGPKRAKDVLITGRLFSAKEAEQLGLVTTVLADGQDLETAANELAEQIAAADENAPGFTARAKAQINGEFDALLDRSYIARSTAYRAGEPISRPDAPGAGGSR